ncbi:uncharacterized protein BO72DRAFT_501377 [Aspergillus fijiensis CBS 313.89]|uniref:Uncharacterized protein n=1 Tax=Aspergillus fijiensis CBS 313.89 TaxID=1448319 RepID=A0A8G1RK90_9EURO|nr:uncharacterized protein BO72DRAFT_501377 [Aspergillus fijiensis CBS 313.89]RAK72006.1 hypothetical protein BO72DRAFT_501377 [Aspergillus fijiensis CBS 313.89]
MAASAYASPCEQVIACLDQIVTCLKDIVDKSAQYGVPGHYRPILLQMNMDIMAAIASHQFHRRMSTEKMTPVGQLLEQHSGSKILNTMDSVIGHYQTC